jgi:hypothetical protein
MSPLMKRELLSSLRAILHLIFLAVVCGVALVEELTGQQPRLWYVSSLTGALGVFVGLIVGLLCIDVALRALRTPSK